MAISKKEQAAIDAKFKEFEIQLSLRPTRDYQSDIHNPSWKDHQYVFCFNSSRMQVDKCVLHRGAIGRNFGCDGDWPQEAESRIGGEIFFSTRELALRAMRRDIELKCGGQLLKIDREIEKEISNPTQRPETRGDE